jgi:hypothetical protein
MFKLIKLTHTQTLPDTDVIKRLRFKNNVKVTLTILKFSKIKEDLGDVNHP